MPQTSLFTERQIFAGNLGGTLLVSPRMPAAPVVLIIPGSGPTDRDGNNPLGIRASTYRLLAWALAERNIASLRIDKRGMYSSARAIRNPNAVTLNDYAADIETWVRTIRAETGARQIWLLGHSEGGLVALAAATLGTEASGLILAATPGRPLGQVMRSQLCGNPANAPILDEAIAIIASLECGQPVDDAGMHAALKPLFRSEAQGFLIDLIARDPARMLAQISKPVLVIQGTKDLQVSTDDARRLAEARSDVALSFLPNVNHVLKAVPGDDIAANFAAYENPDLPLAPGIAGEIANFIQEHRPFEPQASA